MAYHEENILDPYLSPEMDRQIVEMCLAEPRLFMEAYLWVENKDDGEVPFKLRTDQLIVYDLIQHLRSLGKAIRLIILKARQVGVSTFIQAWIFTMCRLRRSTHALIVAHLKPTAKIVYDIFSLFFDRLPKALRPKKKTRTTSKLSFERVNSSVEISTAKTVDFGRGYPLNLIHSTEFSAWPYPEEVLNGLLGGISEGPDSFMAIESTAKGMEGEFFDMWTMAVEGESDADQQWVPIFLAWWQHDDYELDVNQHEAETLYAPDNISSVERILVESWLRESEDDERYGYTWPQWQRKLKWRRTKIASNFRGRELQFNQEYPDTPESAFLAHGQTVYDIEAIRYYMMNTMREGVRGHMSVDGQGNPRFVQGPDFDGDYPLTVWEFPRSNTSYSAGMDAAMGEPNKKSPKAEEVQAPTFPGEEVKQEQPNVRPLTEKEKEKGGDFSAMVVMDINRVQCAEFRKRMIEPASFAEIGALIGKWYGGIEGECLINPEAATGGGNTAGYGMVNRLKKIYHRIDKWERYDDEDRVKLSHSIGWEATSKAMPVFLSLTHRELRRGADLLRPEEKGKYDTNWPKMKIHSKRLLAEMTNFQLRTAEGAMGAVRNKHDDLVRAWGLAVLALEHMRPPDDLQNERIDPRIAQDLSNQLRRTGHAGTQAWANY